MRYVMPTFTVFLLFSCSSSDSSNDPTSSYPNYIEQDLQGKIGSIDWEFVQGRSSEPAAIFSDQINWDFTFLSNERVDICSSIFVKAPDGLKVTFSGEPVPGRKELGKNQIIKLQKEVDGQETITEAKDGFIELTTVSATLVEGKMVAHYDDDFTVNGSFSMVRCCLDETGTDYNPCVE